MAIKKKAQKKGVSANAKSAFPLRPLENRIVVKPMSPETVTKSGIIIPDSAQEKTTEGTVVAVGPGKYEKGTLVPMTVSVGDKIMFSKNNQYSNEEVTVEGTDYYIVFESNVLVIIKK